MAILTAIKAYHHRNPQRVIHSILCTRVLLLILRQRSASTMTNRLPGAGDGFGSDPVLMSDMEDDDTTASMEIITVTEPRTSGSSSEYRWVETSNGRMPQHADTVS
ncbi:hypothetical protein C0991_008629 [Blastosporella zonata]|nr:hypothetical protein C0991_008629 [Blastosporella zonata]